MLLIKDNTYKCYVERITNEHPTCKKDIKGMIMEFGKIAWIFNPILSGIVNIALVGIWPVGCNSVHASHGLS